VRRSDGQENYTDSAGGQRIDARGYLCNRTLNIGLFAGGLSICAAAGALGPIGIVTVGTLIAGKDIPSALEACVKILRRD
jgi:hypothetical protein